MRLLCLYCVPSGDKINICKLTWPYLDIPNPNITKAKQRKSTPMQWLDKKTSRQIKDTVRSHEFK